MIASLLERRVFAWPRRALACLIHLWRRGRVRWSQSGRERSHGPRQRVGQTGWLLVRRSPRPTAPPATPAEQAAAAWLRQRGLLPGEVSPWLRRAGQVLEQAMPASARAVVVASRPGGCDLLVRGPEAGTPNRPPPRA